MSQNVTVSYNVRISFLLLLLLLFVHRREEINKKFPRVLSLSIFIFLITLKINGSFARNGESPQCLVIYREREIEWNLFRLSYIFSIFYVQGTKSFRSNVTKIVGWQKRWRRKINETGIAAFYYTISEDVEECIEKKI